MYASTCVPGHLISVLPVRSGKSNTPVYANTGVPAHLISALPYRSPMEGVKRTAKSCPPHDDSKTRNGTENYITKQGSAKTRRHTHTHTQTHKHNRITIKQ